MGTKKIMVIMEVPDDTKPADLHECLCLTVHESDIAPLEWLKNMVVNIEVPDDQSPINEPRIKL